MNITAEQRTLIDHYIAGFIIERYKQNQLLRPDAFNEVLALAVSLDLPMTSMLLNAMQADALDAVEGDDVDVDDDVNIN